MAAKVSNKTVSVKTETTRGQRIWGRYLEKRLSPEAGKVSIEWPRLITAGHRENTALPAVLRKAKMFEKQCLDVRLTIEDDEQLLLGSVALEPWAWRWNVNWSGRDWVMQEIASGDLADVVNEEDVAEVKEICEYWKDKCADDIYHAWLKENGWNDFALQQCEPGVCSANLWATASTSPGMEVADYEKMLRIGLKGVIVEVEEELQQTDVVEEGSVRKRDFLLALRIVLRASIRYAERNAEFARELAATATGKRKAELEKMAETCAWVPANPARNFQEALQASWFVRCFEEMDQKTPITTPGRMDQFLYPYYKKDIEEGRITREEALELLECYRVKMSMTRYFVNKLVRDFASQVQVTNVTIGGQTPDGKDATNEMSYLFLEAAMGTRTAHPTLSVRVHDGSPREFLLKAVALLSTGIGFPAFFNDTSMMASWSQWGVPLHDLRNYCVTGCVMPIIPGKTGYSGWMYINCGKAVELALNNGIDPRTSIKGGVATGTFEDLKTFDQFYAAYKKQLEHIIEQTWPKTKAAVVHVASESPTLFDSALIADCIQRGKSCMAGGGGGHYFNDLLLPIGQISAADSLTVIKKLVYEEGKIGKQELLKALAANFDGYDDIRRLCLEAPKYGNDEDYADAMAVDLIAFLNDCAANMEGFLGRKARMLGLSYAMHQGFGRPTGALPNGRLAGMTLNDGSVSASQGMDVEGVTALINSAGKIDQMSDFCDLMNVKFHPSALKTKDDQVKLLALIKTHFQHGSKHIQFNVIDKATLVDAKENPLEHKNLLVRVAGYSAFFTALDPPIQDEIINRTEHTLS
ncbi:MAG: hypothetical protein HKP58_07125 [Desulfatitalea sp.]|nr:hypothetical protein [Desulfatitalea sp.]NNK00169.1 hypothetical protein [Desulfatitalea sp.]